jgi:hypothetical protein
VSAPQRAPKPGNLFGCQARPINGSQGARCYTPQQIQQAYGYSGLLASGVNGAGETVVIIDAYNNPYLQSDLNIQSSTFGLPNVTLNKVVMPGTPPFDPTDGNQVGWAEEETLDVLWAHAMAPGAGITLVAAKSNNDDDILAATKFAVDNHLGDVISQSFGEAETCVDPSILSQEHAVFQSAVDQGMTLFASSGDSGASQFNCDGTAAILPRARPRPTRWSRVSAARRSAPRIRRGCTPSRGRGRSRSSAAIRPRSLRPTSTAAAAVSARSTRVRPSSSRWSRAARAAGCRMSRTTQA